jgi:hypothetical protein
MFVATSELCLRKGRNQTMVDRIDDGAHGPNSKFLTSPLRAPALSRTRTTKDQI